VLAFAAILGLWIVAYWLWPVMGAHEVKVTRGEAPIGTGPTTLGQGTMAAATTTTTAAAQSIIDPSLNIPASETMPEVRIGMVIPGARRELAPAAVPATTTSTAPVVVERLIPPEFGTTIVQRGERGFESISKRVYGTTKHAGVISRANPFLSPDKLKPGVTEVRYPLDPSNVQGKVVNVEVRGAGEKPAASESGGSVADGGREYVVTGEDTLSSIAKKFYGKSSAWKVIYDANRDRIASPDRLKPGTAIVIPPQ
jgi:nucleoid-associated protein YgaU